MSTTLKVLAPSLIPKGTPSPARAASPSALRSSNLPSSVSGPLAKDLESLVANVNSLHRTLSGEPPSATKILLVNASGQVVAAFGDNPYKGVVYTNYLSELHVGDPLNELDPAHALFNANPDGSVTIGENGWVDVLDPFGGSAAWLGTKNDTLAVTGATDNGAGLIRLTVPAHTLITGNVARVQNVEGVPNATGLWAVTKIDASHVDLPNSVFDGVFTSAGVIDRVLQVTGAASAAGLIRLTTGVAHTYGDGDQVDVRNIAGVPNASGQWVVSVPDPTHLDLRGSTFAGHYTSGGTVLRYFPGILAQTIAIGPSFQDYRLRAFVDGSLKIVNATIVLSSDSGRITLDPTTPEVLVEALVSGTVVGTIKIDASVPKITTTGTGSLGVTSPPADVYAFASTLADGQVVQTQVFARTTTFPENFAGSVASAGVAPAALATFSVLRDGSPVGDLAIDTGGAWTFSTSGTVVFLTGQTMSIVAPTPADTTLAGVSFTLVGA